MPSTALHRSARARRTELALGVALLWGIGYFWVGWGTQPGRVHDVGLPFDGHIPFVAQAVWPYLCVFPLVLSPLFLIRDARLMYRTGLAYAATIVVSLLCFVGYPVSAEGLRPVVDAPGLSTSVVRALYALDPAYNLCPSLHVSMSVLAALSLWLSRKRHAALLLTAAGTVAVSTCLVKQHFLVDVLAGVVLAALIGGVTLGTYRVAPP